MTSTNSAAATHDIERIVREVMSRLSAAVEPASPPADEQSSSLRITGRVVSLAALDGKLDGVQRLVVAPGAVVTPAAHDYLRECNVRIACEHDRLQPATHTTGVLVAVAETTFDATGLASSLRARGVEVASSAACKLPGAVANLRERILQRTHLGLLLTDQPAPALCMANRTRGVRACTGNDEEDVRRNVAAIGANLLVLEPRGRSLFQLTSMAAAFIDVSSHECPAEYQQVLG